MKKISLILLSACMLVLAGCTTTTYKQENTTPTPAERLYSFQESLPDEAWVRVTRLSNFAGSGCYFPFLINDQLAGRLDMDEQAVFHVPAGLHKFQTTCDWNGRGLCAWGDEETCRNRGQIRTVYLRAGRVYDFRLGYNGWASVFRLYVDEIGKPIEASGEKGL